MSGELSEGKKAQRGDKIYKEPCPVCGSEDIDGSLEQSFHGVPHHFCCTHCKNRFARRPHLYVGSPPHKMAAKQQGKVVRKSHHIALHKPLSAEVEHNLMRGLLALPGVGECRIEDADVKVHYDLVIVSLKDIEHVVEQIAGPLKDSLSERAKRKALHFGEENELDNLAHISGNGAHYHF